MDWYEAVDYCESNFGNSYLADILDQETQDFIDEEFFKTSPSVSYWTGGNDITIVSHQIIHKSIQGIPALCDFTICDPRYFVILFLVRYC